MKPTTSNTKRKPEAKPMRSEGKRNAATRGNEGLSPSKPVAARSNRAGHASKTPAKLRGSVQGSGKTALRPQARVSGLQAKRSDSKRKQPTRSNVELPARVVLTVRQVAGLVHVDAVSRAPAAEVSACGEDFPSALADIGRGLIAALAASDGYRLPLTVASAAAALGTSEAFVLDEILVGPLRAWKDGSDRWRIEAVDFDAYRAAGGGK